jgi:hypothetical protein
MRGTHVNLQAETSGSRQLCSVRCIAEVKAAIRFGNLLVVTHFNLEMTNRGSFRKLPINWWTPKMQP